MFSRVKEQAKEDFVASCKDEYEELMEKYYYSATTVVELEEYHLEVKSKILEDLPKKWKAQIGSAKMSSTVPTRVKDRLDEAFGFLRKTKSIEASKDSTPVAAHKALEFYSAEMEQYLKNYPNAGLDGISTHHEKTMEEAVAMAKTKGGSAMTPKMLGEFRLDIQKSFKIYREKAEMNEKSLEDPAIGIDLGTTMCCIMVYHKGKVMVIQNRAQRNVPITPSYVAFHDDGSDTFGIDAKEQAYEYPETTIYDAKRMIGRDWDDENFTSDREKWPFEVVNENNNPKIKTWGRTRYPHEVSARLLTRFRIMAEDALEASQGSIRKAVITVPAYFTEPQRRATNEAAQCAGLEVLNILSEPTAAAIAYSWERTDVDKNRKALIYDLGGGTFDVAIANVTSKNVEILVVDGDTHLGGQDFDQALMDHCLRKFKEVEGIDLMEGRKSDSKPVRDAARSALSRLKAKCETVKEALSTTNRYNVNVDRIHEDKHLKITVTKSQLDELIKPLVQKTLDIVDRAMKSAEAKGLSGKEDIDDVIIVGGSTRVPLVQSMLEKHFGGKQLCKSINPDEAVAYGAAVQAAILNKNKDIKNVSVEDVTPFSLGIRVVDGFFSPMVSKNSKIPFHHTKRFVTTMDYQTRIKVKVYQGENEMCDDNQYLGEFTLEGLRPRKAELEMADITMSIDSMGMLQVRAESCSTNKSSSITIKAERLGMDEVAIRRIMEECEQIALARDQDDEYDD